MKIVAISDTHCQHRDLVLPKGDILIHAGDVSKRGTIKEVSDFIDWFSVQDFKYKVFIAGNHDFYFEEIKDSVLLNLPESVIYLNDSFTVIEGLKIWGSPIQPWFYNWAFNRHRGEAISKHWNMIPNDADIVVTHGPVYGYLDMTDTLMNVGCEDLLAKIKQVKPKVHICGHIHEAYGTLSTPETLFVNASVLNVRYKLVNNPIEIQI
jgi:Icc-related predicted phosphoesterase